MRKMRNFVGGFVLFVLSIFAYPAMADMGNVWQLVASSFPTPKFMVKPDTPKRAAVMVPTAFKNGNGFRQFGFGVSRHFDTNDPRQFVAAKRS